MNNAKDNFVFLASWIDAIEAYDKAGQPELAGELAKQIIYYGVRGQMTTDNPIVEGFVNAMCVTLIDKSKRRYGACRANGKQGGRPERYPVDEMLRLKNANLTDKEIAENMGCSEQTVSKKLSGVTHD